MADLTYSSSGDSLKTARSYGISGSLSIPSYYTNNVVNYKFYCSCNYYRTFTFEIKMTCNGVTYTDTQVVTTSSNRFYVEGSFTITNVTSSTWSITGFSLQQTACSKSDGISYTQSSNNSATVTNGSRYYTNVSTPSNLSLAQNNVLPSTTVRLSWSASSGGINTSVSKYQIYRNGSYLAETTGTYYDVTSNATNGGTYKYKVKAVSNPTGHDSGFTSEVTLTTTVGSLSAPTGVALDATYLSPGTTTTLRWNAVSNATNNTVTGYIVYKNDIALGTTQTTAYTVTSESTGSAVYKVVAVGSYSNSSASSTVTLYTYTTPTAPTTVALSQETAPPGQTLTLSWSGAVDGSYNAISGYEIYYSSSPSTGYQKYGNTLAANVSSASVVSSSSQGGTYYYKVRVIGTRGDSEDSAVVSVTTYTYTAVGAPDSVSVSPTNVPSGGSATLSWSAGTNTTYVTVSSYQVWRCTTQNGTYERLGNPTTNLSMVVYGPTSGSYYYKVQSIADISGYDSAQSTVIAVLSVNTAPSVPDNFSVTPTEYNTGDLTFSWDASTDPEGGVVYYKITITVNGTTSDVVDGITALTYSIDLTASIDRGDTAVFYVYAYDSVGAISAASDSVSVTRIQAPSSDDIVLVNYAGGNCYSHYPKLIYKANKRLKLSISGWTSYPSGYVDQDEYIILTCNSKKDPSSTNNITVTITITDQYGNTATTSQSFVVAKPTYLSDPAVQNDYVKASQMINLRNLVNAQFRFIEGVAASSWTSGDITAGVTSLAYWLTHLTELRTRIEAIVTFINNKAGTTVVTSPQWEPISVNCPKASAMNQICTYLRDNL